MSCRVQTKDHNSSYKTESTIIETRDSVLADIMHGAVAHAFSCTPTNAHSVYECHREIARHSVSFEYFLNLLGNCIRGQIITSVKSSSSTTATIKCCRQTSLSICIYGAQSINKIQT